MSCVANLEVWTLEDVKNQSQEVQNRGLEGPKCIPEDTKIDSRGLFVTFLVILVALKAIFDF